MHLICFFSQTLGIEIHTDLDSKRGYKDVIDGMGVSIIDLERKFVPFRG